jgi:hypothetical protein
MTLADYSKFMLCDKFCIQGLLPCMDVQECINDLALVQFSFTTVNPVCSDEIHVLGEGMASSLLVGGASSVVVAAPASPSVNSYCLTLRVICRPRAPLLIRDTHLSYVSGT